MINASSSACLIHRRTKSCASSPVRLHLPFGYIEHVIHADHWPAGFLMAILWVTLQPISVSNGSYLAINTKPPQHMLHPWLHVSKSVGPVCTVLLYCAGLGFCYCAVVVGGGCMGHIHIQAFHTGDCPLNPTWGLKSLLRLGWLTVIIFSFQS